jgi:hypothetical protein
MYGHNIQWPNNVAEKCYTLQDSYFLFAFT